MYIKIDQNSPTNGKNFNPEMCQIFITDHLVLYNFMSHPMRFLNIYLIYVDFETFLDNSHESAEPIWTTSL